MTSISTSPMVDHLPQASPGLSEGPSPRLNSPGPLPLPDFKFPAKRPSPTFPSSAPASFSRATGRRPQSAFELKGAQLDASGPEALPQFSFGSQPVSPRTIPRPLTAGSHQRNLSEYIGGDPNAPASTSPTKSEHNLPPPSASRRHAHRRSAAISQNDLSLILKPGPSSPRGSSAPTSPAGGHGYQNSQFSASLDSTVQPSGDAEPSPVSEDNLPSKAIKNTRVGFSDDVQIIPRPLSMISSDSASTVRPGHSVSNSMSSIMSGTSSPPAKEKRGLAPGNRITDPRPRTAEPILDRERSLSPDPPAPRRRGSLPLLSETAAAGLPSPTTPRSAKKWSFFGHETQSGESSPKSRPTSAESSVKEAKKPAAPESEQSPATDTPMPSLEQPSSRRSSISRKPSKKQKKVRSWAGSILGRKSRQRSKKQKLSRRSPTPPLRTFAPMEEPETFDFNQSELAAPVRPQLNTDFTTWKPRKLSPHEESMSPIIDLDAALGPFNTPSSFGEDWDSSQRPGTRKRAMHSAAGLAGFTGPGMHYHRRAESAPEFENPRFGLHRLGSSSTMAMEDVFEEDEDEDEEWEDTKASSDKESSIKASEDEDGETGLGIDIKVVDSEGMDATKQMDFDEDSFHRGVKRKGSGSSDGDRRIMSSTKSVHSAVSFVDEPIEEEESSPVEIADDSLPPRPDSRAQSSDSTATPPFRPNSGKDVSPGDVQSFSLQLPYPTPTSPRSTTQSSLPSPRSPFSYDAQRISTAPSSVTDENAFQSLLLGEPGPELRMSVDDVPSLTSSNSTMTRESMVYPGAGNPQFRDGQRSASLSSATATRKRSSMASLSRLISSSHGEKSKLSIESRAPSTSEGEKKEKTSKGKRISRMMQFWKPKEPQSS